MGLIFRYLDGDRTTDRVLLELYFRGVPYSPTTWFPESDSCHRKRCSRACRQLERDGYLARDTKRLRNRVKSVVPTVFGSERIRDKIAATRRKGKWSGGMPLLGYTVENTKLVVNETEAAQVRQIFDLYQEYHALLPTVKELNRRGWTTKHWGTKKGESKGGRQFTKNSLYALLTNVTYLGQIKYKDEVHTGEHTAIVPQDQYDHVQQTLLRNGHSGGRAVRNKHGALLKGLLRCGSCQCAMSHTYTCRGTRRYAQITRARTTQILTLLNLAPDIQEEILFLPRTTNGRGEIQEKAVRRIAMELD